MPNAVLVKKLQELLQEAGIFNRTPTGVYDSHTLSAVKEFQLSGGIVSDGIVGTQTLMLIYRSFDRFQVPTLTAGRR